MAGATRLFRRLDRGYEAVMTIQGANLLEHLQTPTMTVSNGVVTFANTAARTLLGAHIVGQDVRIAIRDPGAIELILGSTSGVAKVPGLSVGGSVWDVE
jgi:two-component system, OmpR family, phosphate regulon sensor histidine kinase PhoR